jgi:hypothetical protein
MAGALASPTGVTYRAVERSKMRLMPVIRLHSHSGYHSHRSRSAPLTISGRSRWRSWLPPESRRRAAPIQSAVIRAQAISGLPAKAR